MRSFRLGALERGACGRSTRSRVSLTSVDGRIGAVHLHLRAVDDEAVGRGQARAAAGIGGAAVGLVGVLVELGQSTSSVSGLLLV